MEPGNHLEYAVINFNDNINATNFIQGGITELVKSEHTHDHYQYVCRVIYFIELREITAIDNHLRLDFV